MKFFSAVVSAALFAGSVDAFSPQQFGVTPGKKIATPSVVSQEKKHPAVWRPPQMVAGGAERAMGDDYYDGTCSFVICSKGSFN